MLVIGSLLNEEITPYIKILNRSKNEKLSIQIGGLITDEKEAKDKQKLNYVQVSHKTIFSLDLIACFGLPEKYLYESFSIGDYYCYENKKEQYLIIRGPTQEEFYNWENGGEDDYLELLDKIINALENYDKLIESTVIIAPYPTITFVKNHYPKQKDSVEFKLLENVFDKFDEILYHTSYCITYVFPSIFENKDFKQSYQLTDYYSVGKNSELLT